MPKFAPLLRAHDKIQNNIVSATPSQYATYDFMKLCYKEAQQILSFYIFISFGNVVNLLYINVHMFVSLQANYNFSQQLDKVPLLLRG